MQPGKAINQNRHHQEFQGKHPQDLSVIIPGLSEIQLIPHRKERNPGPHMDQDGEQLFQEFRFRDRLPVEPQARCHSQDAQLFGSQEHLTETEMEPSPRFFLEVAVPVILSQGKGKYHHQDILGSSKKLGIGETRLAEDHVGGQTRHGPDIAEHTGHHIAAFLQIIRHMPGKENSGQSAGKESSKEAQSRDQDQGPVDGQQPKAEQVHGGKEADYIDQHQEPAPPIVHPSPVPEQESQSQRAEYIYQQLDDFCDSHGLSLPL